VDHIAIDLGGRNSQVCIRNAAGQVVEEKRCPTSGLRAYLARRPRSRVVVETCAEAFSVADAALAHGHEIRVVPATLVRNLGVGSRRTKTDRRDAQVLSEVSSRIDLPSVHVPTQRARERKTLCGMREGLVQARTQLVNCVRGWLRTQGHRVRSAMTSSFPSRVRNHFAQSSLELPSCVGRQLKILEQLSTSIEEASEELDATAKQDETCRRLMTVPALVQSLTTLAPNPGKIPICAHPESGSPDQWRRQTVRQTLAQCLARRKSGR
jgi:transposase